MRVHTSCAVTKQDGAIHAVCSCLVSKDNSHPAHTAGKACIDATSITALCTHHGHTSGFT